MNRHLFVCIILLTPVISAFAQQPPAPLDPPELVTARNEHFKAMQSASIQPLTNYLRKLESWRQFVSKQGRADAVTAIAAEITKAKEDLAAAQAAATASAAVPIQILIEKAEFGDFATKRLMDVTQYIQGPFLAGVASISVAGSDMVGGRDPAPNVHKTLKVTYTVNGKRKDKTFVTSLNSKLDFKKDLK